MTMKKRWMSTAAVLAARGLVVAGGGAAMAYKDSGVGTRGCPGKYGVLQAMQTGTGNSWAPGDWTGGFYNGQHNVRGSTYSLVVDHQNVGNSGGKYRIVTDRDYSSLRVSCSLAG